MKNMVLLTKEEYDELLDQIARAEQATDDVLWRLDSAVLDCCAQQARADHLWDLLNRPVIEAAAQKHEEEFLDWCAKKSTEYEQKEFDEWVEKKGEFYNTSGKVEFADRHCIPATDEAVADKRYQLWAEVQIRNREPEKTEGWTDLDGVSVYGIETCDIHRKDYSWILAAARFDAWKRYEKYGKEEYLDIAISFDRINGDTENDYNGYYR